MPAALASAAVAVAIAALGPAPLAGEPPAEPALPATAPQAAGTAEERVDAFLDEIERTGAGFESMSGDIAVETVDSFADSQEFRSGRVVVEGRGSARRIALVVDSITIDGRTTKAIDHYLFADGWYSRLDHRNRSFTRRRLVAEGAEPDALESVGNQFPLPIGVRKRDIVARFDVLEAEIPADVPLLANLAGVKGLRLVPKANSPVAEKTASIDVYYDRETVVPLGVVVRAKVANPEWSRWTAARVSKPVTNGTLSDADRALLVVPAKAPEGWAIVDE